MALETCVDCSTRYAVGLAACPNCRSTERTAGGVAVVPLMADTACPNTTGPAAGVQRRVMLPRPTPGVVELPTLLCARCGCALPLAWPGPVEDGDSMSPKITRLGGPSNKRDPESAAAAATDPTPAAAADQAEPGPAFATGGLLGGDAAARINAIGNDEEGGEESSPGSSSSTSTEKPSTTPETSKPAPRKRTPGASRSTRARTASSSAGPADTSGPKTDAPTDEEVAE